MLSLEEKEEEEEEEEEEASGRTQHGHQAAGRYRHARINYQINF